MNLALHYCGKEWRAQRGILVAYAGLMFPCLCLGLLLVPRHFWDEDTFGARALSWFVAAGVIGVVAFVAPGLVRGEFGAKDDQFVRRLPGALWPSFRGKLLFAALAAVALPLLGLGLGELFLQAAGHSWNDLYKWDWTGEVHFVWPWPVLVAAGAMLLAPWIWAIGCWMPGGRMAVGGAVLFALLVGVGVYAVLRQCPNLERRLAWHGWLWAVVPLGVAVAAVSWGRGRRGGGPLRSARFGLVVTAVGLVPPAAWLGCAAYAYHHPDLQHLRDLHVLAIAADGRHALARGAEDSQFEPVHLCIDLETGAAEQLTGTDVSMTPAFSVFAMVDQDRYWLAYARRGAHHRVYDLTDARWLEATIDEPDDPFQTTVLPEELRAQVFAAGRAQSRMHSPDGQPVWFEDHALCREQADGTVVRREYPKCLLRVAGHGFRTFGAEEEYFDFLGRKRLDAKERRHDSSSWIVRDTVVFQPPRGEPTWSRRPLGGEVRTCEPLAGCSVLGLFDDDRLLCARWGNQKGVARRLFLYDPAADRVDELAVPDGAGSHWIRSESPSSAGSLLQRDPAGCLWLLTSDDKGEVYLRVDTATGHVSRVLSHPRGAGSSYHLLGWPDAHRVLLEQDGAILRVELTTGERTVLFPRSRP